MKALTLTQIKTPLTLHDRGELIPADSEVVVRLKAAALNRRDYWITQGLYPGIEPPVVLGSDGAGVVTKCGAGVDGEWVDKEVIINPGLDWGDRQTAQADDFTILGLPRDGTFATEVAVPAIQLHPKPAHLNWHQAAALPLAGVTAYRAVVSQGDLQPGQNVLVTGIGGGVATFALQFALSLSARVWVTSSSPEKIARAVEMGAEGGFDYNDSGWSKELAKQGGAPDLIIDSAAGPGYAALVNVAVPGARIINYGATAGPPEKLDMFKVFWKQLQLQGTTMGSPADFAAMLRLVEDKQIVPVVDTVMPLADGNTAIQSMGQSPQFGKIVLDI